MSAHVRAPARRPSRVLPRRRTGLRNHPLAAPALVAQGIEHGSPKAGVAGSNPAEGTCIPVQDVLSVSQLTGCPPKFALSPYIALTTTLTCPFLQHCASVRTDGASLRIVLLRRRHLRVSELLSCCLDAEAVADRRRHRAWQTVRRDPAQIVVWQPCFTECATDVRQRHQATIPVRQHRGRCSRGQRIPD